MNLKYILVCVVGFVLSATASLAHSPMKATLPAHEAKLDAVPELLQMTFSKPARVLKVLMTHSTGEASHEMRLDIPTKAAVEEIQLTPAFMGEGNYKVEWRALSDDGHVITGAFSFDVMGQ